MARSCERGFATPQFLLAVAMSLLLLATLANLLVQQYALAAVRAALDEGARAGSLVDGDGGACAARIHEALGGLLGGSYGDGVEVSCVRASDQVAAAARVRFAGWAPLVPDVVAELRAEQVGEP